MKQLDEMLTSLRGGVCRVTFTKVNGEKRVMDCTLTPRCIPEDKRPKSESTDKPQSTTTIAVYDVNAEGWRSFKIDSVEKFEEDITA